MTDIVLKEEQLLEYGDNIKAVHQGNLLVLVIDTTKNLGLSSTGKMTTVGSTAGFTRLPAGLSGNVYVGKLVPKNRR